MRDHMKRVDNDMTERVKSMSEMEDLMNIWVSNGLVKYETFYTI